METPAYAPAIRSSLALGSVLITGLAGFTGCGRTHLACHSEESAILIGGRRGISHCVENTQSEIPRGVYPERNAEILRSTQDDSERARNDSLEGFFRSLFSSARLWAQKGPSFDRPLARRLKPSPCCSPTYLLRSTRH